MSLNKVQKSKVVLQRNGLVHVGYLNSANTVDGGFVHGYDDGTQRYAGVFRDASDSGNFVFFQNLTVDPRSADVVDTADGSFARASVKMGALETNATITVSSGDVSLTSGNVSLTSGNVSAASGTVTGGNIQIGTNNIISTDTNGNVSILPNGSGEVLLKADPVSDLGAATKSYVDGVASGLDVKASCRGKTIADLAAAHGVTYATQTITRSTNGAIGDDSASFDGLTLVANDRVLVTEEVLSQRNGIYYVSDVGSAGTPWVLTRDTDADADAKVTPGMFTFIEEGTNADTGWVLTTNAPITVGTTGLAFAQFSAAGVSTASNLGTGSDIFKVKNANDFQFRTVLAASGTNTTNILELTEGTNEVTWTVDQLKITGTGVLDAGSITSNFGNVDVGSSTITTTGAITGGTVQTTSSLIAMATSVLTFAGGTGANEIKMPDNIANALSITEGTTDYLTFTTTDGSESVNFPQGGLSFSSTTGDSVFALTDNLADALSVSEGANNYLRFVTADSSEKIQANQNVEFANSAELHFATATTDVNRIQVPDNLADALSIEDASSNKYVTFISTTGAENLKVNFNQIMETSDGKFAFTNVTSGLNIIEFPDNKANALDFKQGANSYLTFVSTDAGEKVQVYQELDTQHGTVRFSAASGSNIITLTDNLADALSVSEGANNYLRFITTNAGEKVQIAQPIETTNGTMTFAAGTGANVVAIPDNLASAFDIKEGANSYLNFITTNAGEKIVAGQALETTNGTFTFNAASGSNVLAVPANQADALSFNDGTNDYIQIVSTTGSEAITVSQDTTFNSDTTTLNSGVTFKVSTQNTTATIDNTVYFVTCDATSAAIVITLPAKASSVGVEYKFVKVDSSANTVTVQPASGEELDNVADDTLVFTEQGDHSNVACSGVAGWWVW